MRAKELFIDLGNEVCLLDFKSFKDSNFNLISEVGDSPKFLNGLKTISKEVNIFIRLKHFWISEFSYKFQSKFFFHKDPWCVVFDTDDDPEEYKEEIEKVIYSVPSFGIDLGTDGDISRLKKFTGSIGMIPNYIFCPINPFKYNQEVQDYCSENDIKLISTEIYGNTVSEEWMKETFTTDYLEKFAFWNSDGIEKVFNGSLLDYIFFKDNFIGSRSIENDDFPNKYEMDKDIWTDKVKPAKRKIFATGKSIKGSRFNWPGYKNSGVSETSFKDESKISDYHKESMEVLEDFIFPDNFSNIDKKKYSDIIGISRIATSNPGWEVSFNIRGDASFITIRHKYLFWKKKQFICTYLEKNPVIIEIGDEKA